MQLNAEQAANHIAPMLHYQTMDVEQTEVITQINIGSGLAHTCMPNLGEPLKEEALIVFEGIIKAEVLSQFLTKLLDHPLNPWKALNPDRYHIVMGNRPESSFPEPYNGFTRFLQAIGPNWGNSFIHIRAEWDLDEEAVDLD